jgi:CheY-like chemotaxis protein
MATQRPTTVLVVDDHDDIRTLVAEVLEDEGYEVVSASNGQQALSYLRTCKQLPTLILLDLMMPVMDGWRFLAEQKRSPSLRDVPVVILSAHLHSHSLSDLQPAAFLPKPFGSAALLALVAQFGPGNPQTAPCEQQHSGS